MSALTLPDAKAHLNITTAATNDVELQGMIDAAEAILANVVGPLGVQPSRTDRVAGGAKLVLPVAPVVSVASVVPTNGSTVDLSTVSQNLAAGVLYYTDPTSGFWCTSYDVTYVPGRATISADLLLAIKEMVRHLWATQRGGAAARPGQGGEGQVQFAAQVGAMPTRVLELVEPYRLVGVGAA